jgi:hypothetical protein
MHKQIQTNCDILCDTPCNNRLPTNNPITCQLPTGTKMMSMHEADLNLPNCNLPPEALTAHLFPELQHSLLSVGTLCDYGCTTLFNANNVIIEHNGQQLFVDIGIQPTNSCFLTWHSLPSKQSPAQHHLLNLVPTQLMQPQATLCNFFMPPASAQYSQHSSRQLIMVTLQPGQVSRLQTFNVSCPNLLPSSWDTSIKSERTSKQPKPSHQSLMTTAMT